MGNYFSNSKDNRIKKLLKSHNVNKETLAALNKRMMTCYPNGLISREEFVNIYKSYYDSDLISQVADRLFNVFDFNQDGFLDYRETAFLIVINQVEDKDRWSLIFDALDTNDNGLLEFNEFVEVVRLQTIFRGKTTNLDSYKDEMKKVFAHMDVSGDGVISKKEFIDRLSNDPSVFDFFC